VSQFLLSCVSQPVIEPPPAGGEKPSQRVLGIAFDEQVPVVIRLDRSGFPEADWEYMIRIEYVERANTAGDLAAVRSEFLNVFFLAYGSIRESSFVAARTQLVINIWEHDPQSEMKTCHQWLLTDCDVDDNVDSVEAESLTENRWNILQDVRPIPADGIDMEAFTQLYRSCLVSILKRLGFNSLSDIYNLSQLRVTLGRPKKIVRSLDRAVVRGK
jgi:hypothetical protein